MSLDERSVLVVDVGGNHVKVLLGDAGEPVKFDSGPELTPKEMVDGVREVTDGWSWDVMSIGVPTPVRGGRLIAEPVNLGDGWVGFDFEAAFQTPVKVVNDAVMQAIGSYDGGRMLFLGLGTGLGSALILDGVVEPLELGHLPYRKKTFEEYVSDRARERHGKKRWRKTVFDVVERLAAALESDYIVLGGGDVDELDELPPNCRRGGNEFAFIGGVRMWQDEWSPKVPVGARLSTGT